MDYDKVMALPRPEHKLPKKPNLFWRGLIRFLTIFGMMGTKFRYETEGFEKLGKDEPCLILMNHTCFQDMEVAHRILFPRTFQIVASNDGFLGLFLYAAVAVAVPLSMYILLFRKNEYFKDTLRLASRLLALGNKQK